MSQSSLRLTPLQPGQAVLGLAVYLERGRRLIAGTVTAIEEPPDRRVKRGRHCTVAVKVKIGKREYRETEDRLLFAP